MNEDKLTYEEREILIKTIDILSMDVLRLKSENETLKMSLQSVNPGNDFMGRRDINDKPATIWSRTINYYHREGFINTIRKIISKITGH